MSEMIDILNKDGTFTGRCANKREIYQVGHWHRMVAVWLINENNEVLVQRRQPFKFNYPDCWDNSCGGHVSAGQTSIQAICRELFEELGLNIATTSFIKIGEWYEEEIVPETRIERSIWDIYVVCGDYKISDMRLQESEVAEVKYVTPDWIEAHTFDKDPKSILGDKKWEFLKQYMKGKK